RRRSCMLSLRRFAFDVMQERHSLGHELTAIDSPGKVARLEEPFEFLRQGATPAGRARIGIAFWCLRPSQVELEVQRARLPFANGSMIQLACGGARHIPH